jgi:hypothetical protein
MSEIKQAIREAGYCAQSALIWQAGDIRAIGDDEDVDLSGLDDSDLFEILDMIIFENQYFITQTIGEIIGDNLSEAVKTYKSNGPDKANTKATHVY